jgi:hypothetical protein
VTDNERHLLLNVWIHGTARAHAPSPEMARGLNELRHGQSRLRRGRRAWIRFAGRLAAVSSYAGACSAAAAVQMSRFAGSRMPTLL